jgi:hypothetical protein
MTDRVTTRCAFISFLLFFVSSPCIATEIELKVLPTEHLITHDAETGATLTFLTTNPAADTNLYFHDRSWLADNSMIVFYSNRSGAAENTDPETGVKQSKTELMGYIAATGELAILTTPSGSLGAPTCAINRNSVFAIRNGQIIELTLRIEPSKDAAKRPSRVFAEERVLCAVPPNAGTTALNESCDGKYLSIGMRMLPGDGDPAIFIVDTTSGELKELCRVGSPPTYMFHVQWSHTNPNLLSFAGAFPRLNVVDIRDGKPRSPYHELPGELVTHEHWWVNDQIVFCGGLHPEPTEDSHVKVVDVNTGVVRILAAGSWWPGATDDQIAKRNYWHCAGSDDGRWVVADSWHGDITIIEGKSCRPRLLTTGHREYGPGKEHPHVGWDRKGEQVIFCSHKLGDPNVCVATIPKEWQEQNK